MRKSLFLAGVSLAMLLAAGCGGHMSAAPPVTPDGSGIGDATQSVAFATSSRRVCSLAVPAGFAHCDSWIRTDVGGPNLVPNALVPNVSNGPYRPSDLRSAYKLPSTTNGTGQVVAIVDAFNDSNAESDMNHYRSTFGIAACTSATGCFKKVNQNGVAGSYPAGNASWGLEISLDLDMVSAVCPKCHIILVEATNNSLANFEIAANRAVTMGAKIVSNSYGGTEFATSASAYNHPGHLMVASAGDNGTGPQQPCSFSTVVCAGGTHLIHATNTRGWSETVWSGTGSGCSAKVAKPAWQHDTGCHMRSESDLSAVADPNTGVFIYDTFGVSPGFYEAGGTSASSPILAAAYALAGNAATENAAQPVWTHGGTASFFDVTSGSNGSCAITYICHARVGYDGPTGWGTPDGLSAL